MKDYDPTDLELIEIEKTKRDEELAVESVIKAEIITWMMGDYRGRRLVWDFMEWAGIWRTTFNGDPLVMAFNEGKRNSGLKLLSTIMEHCPESYTEMIKEQKK